jgi:hypothetical protein
MINMPDAKLKPESCDHVFEAEYCIKSTSLESNLSSYHYCTMVFDCVALLFVDFLVFLTFSLEFGSRKF